jgi:anti-sigma regulatory factor (Ser/Thr protein kinase)
MADLSQEPIAPFQESDGAPLQALVLEPQSAERERLRSAFEAHGLRVETPADPASALKSPRADALWIHAHFAAGAGLALARRLTAEHAGSVWCLYGADSAAEVRAAWQAGACDALPGRPPADELLAALRPALAASTSAAGSRSLDLELSSDRSDQEQATIELGSLAFWAGMGPAARGRLLCALAELYENARRHAYPQAASGPVRLRALARSGRIEVVIEDRGQGFQGEDQRTQHLLEAAGLDRFPAGRAYAAGGLIRARSLCERFACVSTPGQGTRIEFSVIGYPASFSPVPLDFEDAIEESLAPIQTDLSDRDFLDPSELRRLLLALTRENRRPVEILPPALAVTLGRVLNAAAQSCAQVLKRSA